MVSVLTFPEWLISGDHFSEDWFSRTGEESSCTYRVVYSRGLDAPATGGMSEAIQKKVDSVCVITHTVGRRRQKFCTAGLRL